MVMKIKVMVMKVNIMAMRIMMAQKNRKDPATTEHHPPENEVDFELLWRCISKIPKQF